MTLPRRWTDRWADRWAQVIAGLLCLLPLFLASRSDLLLQDSDTKGILLGIRERGNRLSWFWTDWPLFNHFYRPLPTLFFEFDQAVWPGWNYGFALTNALIVAGGCFGLYALAAEWLQDRKLALIPLALGLFWVLFGADWNHLFWSGFLGMVAWGATRRHTFHWTWIPLGFIILSELFPIQPLRFRMMDWLPGRTASTMVLFAMPALIFGLKSMRSDRIGRDFWVCLGFTMLALMSYEQAVMLPFVMASLAIALPTDRKQHWVRLGFCMGTCVAFYLVLRTVCVSWSVSGYQAQQFRDGPGVLLSVTDYVQKELNFYRPLLSIDIRSPEIFLTEGPWRALFGLGSAICAAIVVIFKREYRGLLWIVFASFLAFLPMAFLKPFEHYHFWPMLLRAMLFGWLAQRALAHFDRDFGAEMPSKIGEHQSVVEDASPT